MSNFSRHDYLWLARALAKANARFALATDRAVLREAIESIADDLAEDNHNFDRKMFLQNIYSPHAPHYPSQP